MKQTAANGRIATLRRDLRSMTADGASFSVMVGVGETYVPAFALMLGLGEVAAGLIATVPILAGGLLQLISPWAVRRLGSHRRWVVACAICQAASLVLMSALALATGVSPWLVFLPATLYWAAGLATGPPWNAWVEQLVPGSIRATFFAHRTRVSHLCVLLGLIAGGIMLRVGTLSERIAVMFALLFGVAAASRLLSAFMLSRQSEPVSATYLDQSGASIREVLRGMRGAAGIRLVCYLLAVQAAVHLAAPFFTPFMLVHLELSYVEYMMLLGFGFLGKILALPWAGRFAKRAGPGRLLWIGGVAIVPLSAMWLVSNELPFLIGLQIFGGMAWAAYELAMLLLFFQAIPRERRVAMLSLYNAGSAAAMVIGAWVGAAVLQSLADGKGAYLVLFGLSAVGRVVALLLIPRHIPRVPRLPGVQSPTGLRTIAVRPVAGSIERPILPSVASASESSSAA